MAGGAAHRHGPARPGRGGLAVGSLGRTPTHYQTLGVAPDARPDEVRRAYLRLALEHHPDRHRSAGADDRARADERIRAVNAAWEVLGDEGRRRAYDRELARAGAAERDAFSHLARRRAVIDDVEEGDDQQVQVAPPLVRAIPLLVVLGLLGLIFVFTAYAGGGGDEEAPEGVDATQEVPRGTCITLPPEGGIEEVECGTPSDGTVADIVPLGEACPVPLVGVPNVGRGETLCLRD